MHKFREPTGEECNKHSKVPLVEGGGLIGVAAWYPQMGGYSAKCLIVSSGQRTPVQETYASVGGCFEAYVWHDGDFPFVENKEDNPRELHHCDADQFIEFGQLVKRIEQEIGPADTGGFSVEKTEGGGTVYRMSIPGIRPLGGGDGAE